MSKIIKLIDEIELANRNNLKYKCTDQITAALNAGDALHAVMFLTIVFEYGIERSKEIVDEVRRGTKFCDIQPMAIK